LREYRARIAEIESAVRLLKIPRPFEVDLQRLRIHLRVLEEDGRLGADIGAATNQEIHHILRLP